VEIVLGGEPSGVPLEHGVDWCAAVNQKNNSSDKLRSNREQKEKKKALRAIPLTETGQNRFLRTSKQKGDPVASGENNKTKKTPKNTRTPKTKQYCEDPASANLNGETRNLKDHVQMHKQVHKHKTQNTKHKTKKKLREKCLVAEFGKAPHMTHRPPPPPPSSSILHPPPSTHPLLLSLFPRLTYANWIWLYTKICCLTVVRLFSCCISLTRFLSFSQLHPRNPETKKKKKCPDEMGGSRRERRTHNIGDPKYKNIAAQQEKAFKAIAPSVNVVASIIAKRVANGQQMCGPPRNKEDPNNRRHRRWDCCLIGKSDFVRRQSQPWLPWQQSLYGSHYM
jgi:hypothetical protein